MPEKHNGESCGTTYAWTGSTRRPAPLPAWIPQLLEERHRNHTTVTRGRRAHGCIPRAVAKKKFVTRAAMRSPPYGEAERVAAAKPGCRNDAVNYAAWRLARHLHSGTLTENEITAALAHAAEECGLTVDDGRRAVHNTIRSALRSGGRTL